jgi:hypothetical protein
MATAGIVVILLAAGSVRQSLIKGIDKLAEKFSARQHVLGGVRVARLRKLKLLPFQG